ncbi:MAG TPA: 50S ribosomal protein L6 [Thermoanaerobaculales bacterium]|nr:50S ribosomal protein L6 [Thermoanaerobaculales bacterium]HPA80749.1 50S ribosomal protein L6 [Thermoanaerobaculales bacterium]
MSRIGRKPIQIPKGVEVSVDGREVRVKGPKGTLSVGLLPGVEAAVKDGAVDLSRNDDERHTRSFHGLLRALLANAVTGVSSGWSKELEIVGIGYRAEKRGDAVVFNLGHSHPIDFAVPEGIQIDVDAKANRVAVRGIDRQLVGQVAADIRALRPPEPYKGKGVRYLGEKIRSKAGKQGATA